MSLNYVFTDDFSLIQITFAIIEKEKITTRTVLQSPIHETYPIGLNFCDRACEKNQLTNKNELTGAFLVGRGYYAYNLLDLFFCTSQREYSSILMACTFKEFFSVNIVTLVTKPIAPQASFYLVIICLLTF